MHNKFMNETDRFKRKLMLYACERNYFYFDELQNAFHTLKMFKFSERIEYLQKAIEKYNELKAKKKLNLNLELSKGSFIEYATKLINHFENRKKNQTVSDELRKQFFDDSINLKYIIEPIFNADNIDLTIIKDAINDYLTKYSTVSVYFLEELKEFIYYQIKINPYIDRTPEQGKYIETFYNWLENKHNVYKNKNSDTKKETSSNEPRPETKDFEPLLNKLIATNYNGKPIIEQNLKADFIKLEQNTPLIKINWCDTDFKIILILQKCIDLGFFIHLKDIDLFQYVSKNFTFNDKPRAKNDIKSHYDKPKNEYELHQKDNIYIKFKTKLDEVTSNFK